MKGTVMGSIEHIFIAPHHGKPMAALAEAEAIAGCGLRGDRYAKPSEQASDEQITLIEAEHIEGFVRMHGLTLAPDQPRRNVVTRGVDLNRLCGTRFAIGDVELEGVELCEPCGTFAKRTYPEILSFFFHKGGLRARIVRGGIIRVGDTVGPSDAS